MMHRHVPISSNLRLATRPRLATSPRFATRPPLATRAPLATDQRFAMFRGPRRRQGGFNFAEILFAVMILGIGFIMIAAIFPVALSQTKLTGEEVIATTSARSGVNFVQQVGLIPTALPHTISVNTPPQAIAANSSLTLPGAVYSFRDSRIPDRIGPPLVPGPIVRDQLWNQISGNLILPSDNRQAWVALYRRAVTFTNTDTGAAQPHNDPTGAVTAKLSPYAQVFVIAVQSRNRSAFDLVKDVRRYPDNGPAPGAVSADVATLEPKIVYVKLTEGNANPDRIAFFTGAAVGAGSLDELAADEGAFVIISDDQMVADNLVTTRVNESNGNRNGRIYRLGAQTGTGEWELAPGWDMDFQNPDGTVNTADDINENLPPRDVGAAPAGLPALAFMVGRGYADPTAPRTGTGLVYEGKTQDVAIYTSFVPAN